MTGRIEELIKDPPTPEAGAEVLAWVDSRQEFIASGGLYSGIVSLDEVALVPLALEYAAKAVNPELYLRLAHWYISPPTGEPKLECAEDAVAMARSRGVARADIELVELRWFWRRDEASPDEKSEVHELLESRVRADPQDSEALHLLGLITCEGFGTTASPERAIELQHASAALGCSSAMFELFVHYAQGLGTDPDPSKAFSFNQQAAELGHSRATYNMGAFYASGQYVTQDLSEAAKWYSKSSDLGNPRATATLALMYAQGSGVEQDLEYADELFGIADYMEFDVTELRALAGLPPL